jgi:hypothetical protein
MEAADQKDDEGPHPWPSGKRLATSSVDTEHCPRRVTPGADGLSRSACQIISAAATATARAHRTGSRRRGRPRGMR